MSELKKNIPLVAFIIPCFRQVQYLEECLRSIHAQTYQNYEVIMVDDGSDDGSQELFLKLRSLWDPGFCISLIRQNNGGLPDARNRGVSATQSKYYVPLDADDLILPTFLEQVVSVALSKPDVDVVFTDVEYFGVQNEFFPAGPYDVNYLKLGNRLNYCGLIKRSLWEKVSGYSTNMAYGHEDWEFWIKTAASGATGERVAAPIFRYRTKSESMYTNVLKNDCILRSQLILNNKSLYPQYWQELAAAIVASYVSAKKGDSQSANANLTLLIDLCKTQGVPDFFSGFERLSELLTETAVRPT